MDSTQFGRYRIIAELGRGAMGAVYRAVDPLIEREVAIKTLLPSLPPEVLEEVRERFLREAKSAGRLNHPNIVTIYDVGEQNGTAYIAMELLEGRSLQQMMREPQRLPVETIAELVAQVADALDHATGFGIVHRDVKPANVMVSEAGRAKLTDFGVAHVPSSSMTQTGMALGSPKYMSPEQVLGQPIDPRSDIFSLGVMLYEMLVRRTPFERAGDTNVFALMHRIAGEAHAPVSEFDRSLPQALDAILARALAKSPAQRYQRAGEMALDLRRVRGGAAAASSSPGAGASDAYEKTVVVRGGAAPADSEKTVRINPGTGAPASSQLLADLDAFSTSFEQRQEAQLREEETARKRKEAELKAWAEVQERRRREFEQQKTRSPTSTGTAASDPTATDTGTRRSSALELLRKRGTSQSVEEDKNRRMAEAAELDARLREAFRYLSELTVELNSAQPAAERAYALLYVGELKGCVLRSGFTDYRAKHVLDKDRVDYVVFKYRVHPPTPARIDVSGQEYPRVTERLNAMQVTFRSTAKHNDFGQVARATLMIDGGFPCQVVLRADYDKAAVVMELINVRQQGPAQVRFALKDFDDNLLEEFATYVLGADDAFARHLKRR